MIKTTRREFLKYTGAVGRALGSRRLSLHRAAPRSR